MVKIGYDIFKYDDTTKTAEYFYQGDLFLTLKVEDYKQAHGLYGHFENIYKHGVKDGVAAAIEAIDSVILV